MSTFNDTPHYEAHRNFIVSLRTQPCANVHSVLADERCLFVRETEECRESVHYIDYMHFMYCAVDSSNVALFSAAIVGLLMVVVVLASIIHYLCTRRYVDAILYASKSFRLTEYMAGVTLLTYGNGLPHVLSQVKHHQIADTERIYNQYLGSAVYQIAFLASTVIFMGRKFFVHPEVIVPNIIAVMLVAVLVEAFMYVEYVGLFKTTILLIVYVIFLVALSAIASALNKRGDGARSLILLRDGDGNVLEIAEPQTSSEERFGLWQQWYHYRDAYRTANWYGRLYTICMAPVELLALLILPRVHHLLPLGGWNKYLFTVSLNVLPPFLFYTLLAESLTPNEMGFLCLGSLLTTLAGSVAICILTTNDQRPVFFAYVALFTVFGTSYLVLLLTRELVAILETLSIIADISPPTFAITILSWGHCWIDLVTYITLARRGYERLAFAACYGSPLFNILIGLCVVFSVQMIRTGSMTIHVRDGTSGPTCAVHIFVISFGLLLTLLFTRFWARASLAMCLMKSYATFMVFIVLHEIEFLHGYGTDHNDDGEFFQDQIPQHAGS
ncbi:mitochondrial sodium/calcium exchanger protein-like [Anopheles bellator]|uniref:mitochondrial sodium/calcium exchanger protein-like n=1 Tax=Anopheles bellator TaxID=139047 RepID=UPI0026474834|nr:mitochondrial sodium/calcium exchanger protein-like [Anopheles bellator]